MKREIAWSGLGICILIFLSGLNKVNGQAEKIEAKYRDHLGVAPKIRLYQMSEEIVADITERIGQTEGMREEHGNHLLFEIGTMLGQVKEKYKRQYEMFRQTYNSFHNISSFKTPEDWDITPGHYFIVLEFVVAKQMEIEQLIEVILKVPKEELHVYTPLPQKILSASGFGRNLRTRDSRHPKEPGEFPGRTSQEAVEQEIIRMAKEEKLKKQYRADYMKRHGNNVAKRK